MAFKISLVCCHDCGAPKQCELSFYSFSDSIQERRPSIDGPSIYGTDDQSDHGRKLEPGMEINIHCFATALKGLGLRKAKVISIEEVN